MIDTRLKITVSIALLFTPLTLHAQTTESTPTEKKEVVDPEEQPLFYPEIEFVGSTKFRDAAFIMPVWRKLNFEGLYFGDDHQDIGFLGGNWTFEFLKKITIAPGLSATFGSAVGTAPAATVRWSAEHGWFHAQGFSSLSLIASTDLEEEAGKEKYRKRAYISDGNHLSARWKRVESGFSWEHIATREENEWKTGGRFDVALTRHLNFVAFILAPDIEFRCGLRFHPPEKEH